MSEDGFWDDQKEAQKLIQELNHLKDRTNRFSDLEERLENAQVLHALVEEENDAELLQELQDEVKTLEEDMSEFELDMLLNESYDANNAILELHPGAGGTESQDFASMLLRMYQRWAETKGYTVDVLNYLAGDEAGVKSVTLHIKGHNAYGYLKAEKGVHRLVRISPFDASGRRHTSFVSCDVSPELSDDIEIEIKSEDLKIDTYRSSGAGGQHVNVTDSAVRITHLPTGIVVTCQSGRSQIQNRQDAMKMLKAKLYQQEIERQEEELREIKGEQKEIAWGNQIRSYIMHPYSLVRDHRIDLEIGNVEGVLDGNIDPFIDGYLRLSLHD